MVSLLQFFCSTKNIYSSLLRYKSILPFPPLIPMIFWFHSQIDFIEMSSGYYAWIYNNSIFSKLFGTLVCFMDDVGHNLNSRIKLK